MTTISENSWNVKLPDNWPWEAQLTGPVTKLNNLEWRLSIFISPFHYNSKELKIKFQLIIENEIFDSHSIKAYYTILVKDFDNKICGQFVNHENISDKNFKGIEYWTFVPKNDKSFYIKVNLMFETIAKIVPNADTLFNKMSADLNTLLNDDKHSDVVLKSSDNIEIPAHKCLLTARSSVFAAMFKHDMKENKEKFIIIDDIDSVTLKAVLQFMYTGKFEPTKHGNLEVLAAADKYDLQDLRDLCETEIIDNININNAITALVTADKHNLKPLKEKSCKFLAAFMKKNLNSSNFQELKIENLPLFEEILNLAMSNHSLE